MPNFIKWIFLFVVLILLLFLFLFLTFYDQPAQLTVEVVDDATGLSTPVRVRLINADGEIAPLPVAAIGVMYGRADQAEGYALQPDGAFYVDGMFTVSLEPGTYQLSISKGIEYLNQQHEITLKSGKNISKTFKLERWINMPEQGWYSADDHIHIRRSPSENPNILKWVAAEDIHVGALLQMGDSSATYYHQYAWGQNGVYQIDQHLLTSGQEDPRTHQLGHTIFLTADDQVRSEENYYLYDIVFDQIHELDGLTGYAHQGVLFNGYRGMTLDVLQNKVDFLELLQFCMSGGPLQPEHYYQFLDLGYKLTATAGSDFPWCGYGSGWNAQIGNARFYTYIDDAFNFESWKENFKTGHTFVSSGPMLDLRVNDKLPGDSLDLEQGSTISIIATAFGHEKQVPLTNLEIIAHGKVVGSVNFEDSGQSTAQLHLEMEMPVTHGIWVAARSKAGDLQIAHTTPIYITINGDGFFNAVTAPHYLALSEQYLQELEQLIANKNNRVDSDTVMLKEALEARITETRTILEELKMNLK